jgi:hypothetical protein
MRFTFPQPTKNKESHKKSSKAIFEHDKQKDGWTLIEEGPKLSKKNQKLEIVSFLKEGESYINGEEMRKRAKELGSLGQHQAEQLLKQASDIPEEWKNYYLLFPETVWRHPGGLLYVPYLYWDGGRWVLRFGYVDDAAAGMAAVGSSVSASDWPLDSCVLVLLSPWILGPSCSPRR